MTPRAHNDFSDVLACPSCHAELRLDAPAQSFVCNRHGRVASAAGFPSFVAGHDAAFEEHWEDNRSDHIAEHKLQAAREFLTPLLTRFRAARELRILDAGCGEGAHVSVLSDLRKDLDDRSVAMDIAASALHDAARHAGPGWRFVHADMSSLPLRSGAFDAAFSFGVLHLTPSPQRSFAELCRVLRPGGLLGLWVFRGGPITRGGLRTARALARALGTAGTRALANMIVPFYGLIPSRSGLAIGNSTWRQTREVLLSNLTPPYMHFLTMDDFERWCGEHGMKMLPAGDVPLTAWAVKD